MGVPFWQFSVGQCPSKILASTVGAHRNPWIAIVIQQSFLILFSSWRWISVFHAPIYWPSKKHYVAWVTSDFEMSCRQTLSSSLVDQVILKCKSMNVTSTPHHFNGLELSPIPSFWPSPLFFLVYRPLYMLSVPHGTSSPHCPHLLANLHLSLCLNFHFTFSWKLSQPLQTSPP